MEIKKKYITDEQAKILKEKGLFLEDKSSYDFTVTNPHTGKVHSIAKKYYPNYEQDYFSSVEWSNDYIVPEQWQVVEWLRIKYGILVYVKLGYGHEFVIQKTTVPFEIIYTDGTFKSPQEAYNAAFDYILKIMIWD